MIKKPSSNAGRNEGGSSSGKKESVANVPRTQRGNPLAQPEPDDKPLPDSTTDASSNKDQLETRPCQETKIPCATSSPSDSAESSAVVEDGPADCSTQNVCSSRAFESRELMLIAQRICGVWISVAMLTDKFKRWEIDNIIGNQNYQTPDLKANKMLDDFKARLGTREVLASAIENCDGQPRDLAAKVRSGFFIDNTD